MEHTNRMGSVGLVGGLQAVRATVRRSTVAPPHTAPSLRVPPVLNPIHPDMARSPMEPEAAIDPDPAQAYESSSESESVIAQQPEQPQPVVPGEFECVFNGIRFAISRQVLERYYNDGVPFTVQRWGVLTAWLENQFEDFFSEVIDRDSFNTHVEDLESAESTTTPGTLTMGTQQNDI